MLPLQRGEYVRWEFDGRWVEGEIEYLDWEADVVTIKIVVCSPESWMPGEVHGFGMDWSADSCVRRVQRPLPS